MNQGFPSQRPCASSQPHPHPGPVRHLRSRRSTQQGTSQLGKTHFQQLGPGEPLSQNAQPEPCLLFVEALHCLQPNRSGSGPQGILPLGKT